MYKSLEVNIFYGIKKYAAILLVALCALVSFTRAGEYQSEILQYKLDRLYFSSGEEANIFTGSRFVIVHDNDTIYQGEIDASYPGISYSTVIDRTFGSIVFDGSTAFIETADIDSGAIINIGLNEIDTKESDLIFDDSLTTACNPVKLILTLAKENNAAMFEKGQLDILLSYDSSLFTLRHSHPQSRPAPYFAVLVPNLEKTSTAGGMLATSLYYRYSSFYLPFMFGGDRAEPVYSFLKADGTGHRAYPYDLDKGARLFKNINPLPEELTLSIDSRSLKKTADFFADMLARDRVRVNIVEHDPEADFFLIFVPLEADSPQVSMKYIYRFLSVQEITDRSARENLTIIGDCLESASKAIDTATRLHYCRLADRSLKYDLGVFPLYRPDLFMVTSKRIKNCRFDAVGRPTISELYKLVLPTDRMEVTP